MGDEPYELTLDEIGRGEFLLLLTGLTNTIDMAIESDDTDTAVLGVRVMRRIIAENEALAHSTFRDCPQAILLAIEPLLGADGLDPVLDSLDLALEDGMVVPTIDDDAANIEVE